MHYLYNHTLGGITRDWLCFVVVEAAHKTKNMGFFSSVCGNVHGLRRTTWQDRGFRFATVTETFRFTIRSAKRFIS